LYCYLFRLNNKGKQGRQNKLKSKGTNNLRARRAEKIELLYAEMADRNCLQILLSAVRAPIRLCKYLSIMAWPYKGTWGKWPLGRPEMAII